MNPKPGAHGMVTLPSGKKIDLKIFSAQARSLSQTITKEREGTFVLSEKKEILLCCKQGGLFLEEVQPESRTRMSFLEFVRGHAIFVTNKN